MQMKNQLLSVEIVPLYSRFKKICLYKASKQLKYNSTKNRWKKTGLHLNLRILGALFKIPIYYKGCV